MREKLRGGVGRAGIVLSGGRVSESWMEVSVRRRVWPRWGIARESVTEDGGEGGMDGRRATCEAPLARRGRRDAPVVRLGQGVAHLGAVG